MDLEQLLNLAAQLVDKKQGAKFTHAPAGAKFTQGANFTNAPASANFTGAGEGANFTEGAKFSGDSSANITRGAKFTHGEGAKFSRRKVERPHWKQRVCQSEHRHVYGSREETLGLGMTEVQREVFLMVDEFWKARGYAPSVREIAMWRKRGLSNTQKVIDRLVKIGALKRIEGMQRTLRPTYMRFRDIE